MKQEEKYGGECGINYVFETHEGIGIADLKRHKMFYRFTDDYRFERKELRGVQVAKIAQVENPKSIKQLICDVIRIELKVTDEAKLSSCAETVIEVIKSNSDAKK